ncbi:MAG: aminotransferase class V-fold PLP-dependent enzyme [Methanobacteriaceae archaeon]|nr:aminotransferase class V-fold PLP-dependent enzyme [Methanobacteriaceae archaeon]
MSLQLYYKKPSPETINAMCRASKSLRTTSRSDQIQKTQEKITHFVNHEHVKLVNSGNSAIMAVMSTLKNKILIPDEGGWVGFKKIADLMGLEVVYIPTSQGIIELDVLEKYLDNHRPEALFLTSLAGYIAEQPVKDLFELCDDRNVLMVEDASGAIGDPEKRLANGEHSHVIIASTGSPKIVNVGNGGFISTNDYKILKDSKNILNSVKIDRITAAGIYEEINHAPHILNSTINACQKMKKEFNNAMHQDKRGIVLALIVDDPRRVGYIIRKNIMAENRRVVTICPDYNRTLSSAVCFELKNLDVNCLKSGIVEKIIFTIKNSLNDY